MKYRKRPVVIDAWQPETQSAPEWAEQALRDGRLVPYLDKNGGYIVRTLEDARRAGPDVRSLDAPARHIASRGDWIICGTTGELWAIKPDIFETHYEPA